MPYSQEGIYLSWQWFSDVFCFRYLRSHPGHSVPHRIFSQLNLQNEVSTRGSEPFVCSIYLRWNVIRSSGRKQSSPSQRNSRDDSENNGPNLLHSHLASAEDAPLVGQGHRKSKIWQITASRLWATLLGPLMRGHRVTLPAESNADLQITATSQSSVSVSYYWIPGTEA
jgi:hypothetical protein